MATTKRKLPVLQSGGERGEADEPRPPWQWVGFGTVMIFTVWVPLAYIGAALLPARTEAGAEGATLARVLIATVAPLVLAAGAGGFLVGRFGKPAGVREALLAGLATGLVAVVLTALSAPFSPLFLLVAALATAAAGAGGTWGRRGRPF